MSQSRQLAAIMFTDITGYTALMEQDEKRAIEVLKANLLIHRSVIHEFNGRLIKELGDGMLTTFPTVSDSLNAAIKIQKQCHEINEFKLSIGIHQGEIILENGDIFGDAVNVASRIQSLGVPGSILFSKKIADDIKNKSEFHMVSLGSFEFKNVHEPIEVFALANEGFPVPKRNRMQGKLKKNNLQTRKVVIAFSVVLSVASIMLIYKNFFSKKDDGAATDKSIAVLPFVNISSDSSQDYFGEGISEEIINVLAQNKELKVIARSSSFQFKGKNEDLREVGNKLGVAYVIEGSVRKERDTVRITAQLIRASDGSHLWSSTYNRTVVSALKVQDEIAASIRKRLEVSLLNSPRENVQFHNPDAHKFYLQGKDFANIAMPENFKKAIMVLKQSLSLEPDNSKTWAALATVYALQENNGFEKNMGLASEAAYKAIALDSSCADAHIILGWINTTFWYRWSEAEANFKKALSIEPNNALAKCNLGILYSALGKFELGSALQKESITHDPLNSYPYFFLAFNLIYTNQYDEAERLLLKVQKEIIPDSVAWPFMLGMIYLFRDGRPEKAIEQIKIDKRVDWRTFGLAQAYYAAGRKAESDLMLSEMINMYDNGRGGPLQVGEIYAYRGEADKAFEWFDKAYESRVIDFIVLKKSPWIKKILKDPRYKALLKKLNLPPD